MGCFQIFFILFLVPSTDHRYNYETSLSKYHTQYALLSSVIKSVCFSILQTSLCNSFCLDVTLMCFYITFSLQVLYWCTSIEYFFFTDIFTQCIALRIPLLICTVGFYAYISSSAVILRRFYIVSLLQSLQLYISIKLPDFGSYFENIPIQHFASCVTLIYLHGISLVQAFLSLSLSSFFTFICAVYILHLGAYYDTNALFCCYFGAAFSLFMATARSLLRSPGEELALSLAYT